MRRLVLYRRSDDEWVPLAEQEVELPQGYITLEVELDEDAMRCRCEELGVEFFYTDANYKRGKTGIRAVGRLRVASVRVLQTKWEIERDRLFRFLKLREREELARGIADAVPYRTLELPPTARFSDFARERCYDVLVEGETLRALSAEGELLWEVPEDIRDVVFSKERCNGARLLYGLTGLRRKTERTSVIGGEYRSVVADELVVIDGKDGSMKARTKLPAFPETLDRSDLSPASVNLTGTGFDIIVREWRKDCGNGGVNLWAYDMNLDLLRKATVHPPYGHHYAVQSFDVDGDGREEVLAGGTLLSADGKVIWVHDLAEEMGQIYGAGHYDAVLLGNLSESELDPVCFLIAGSAGVYVVDGRTGGTRMVHRVGHAQGRAVGKVRDDLPGEQVLAPCRWGNMGILTLFSGRGERLWSIQPDYIGQGSCPVEWAGRRLIWTNTSASAQAFYDGFGRRVKELPELRRLWGGRMRRDVSARVVRLGTDPTQYLALSLDGRFHLFGPRRD